MIYLLSSWLQMVDHLSELRSPHWNRLLFTLHGDGIQGPELEAQIAVSGLHCVAVT